MAKCLDHIGFVGEECPDCRLQVDEYGNTEEQFEFCSFPKCGCDGAQHCMAGKASESAERANVHGMYTSNKPEHAKGRLATFGESLLKGK